MPMFSMFNSLISFYRDIAMWKKPQPTKKQQEIDPHKPPKTTTKNPKAKPKQ